MKIMFIFKIHFGIIDNSVPDARHGNFCERGGHK
jgi:hypothetical protein